MTTDTDNLINQSELKANTRNRCQAQGNMCKQVTIGFVNYWFKKWPRFFGQSQVVVMQNQSNWEITSDTHLKTILSTFVKK